MVASRAVSREACPALKISRLTSIRPCCRLLHRKIRQQWQYNSPPLQHNNIRLVKIMFSTIMTANRARMLAIVYFSWPKSHPQKQQQNTIVAGCRYQRLATNSCHESPLLDKTGLLCDRMATTASTLQLKCYHPMAPLQSDEKLLRGGRQSTSGTICRRLLADFCCILSAATVWVTESGR